MRLETDAMRAATHRLPRRRTRLAAAGAVSLLLGLLAAPAPASAATWTLTVDLRWSTVSHTLPVDREAVTFQASVANGTLLATLPYYTASWTPVDIAGCTSFVAVGGVLELSGVVEGGTLTITPRWTSWDHTVDSVCAGEPDRPGSLTHDTPPVEPVTIALSDGAEHVDQMTYAGAGSDLTYRLAGREEYVMTMDAGEVLYGLFPSGRAKGGVKVDWRLVARFGREPGGRWTAGTATLRVLRRRTWRTSRRAGRRVLVRSVGLVPARPRFAVQPAPLGWPRSFMLELLTSTEEPLRAKFTLREQGRKALTLTITRRIPELIHATAESGEIHPPSWSYGNLQLLDIARPEVVARTPRYRPVAAVGRKTLSKRRVLVTVARTA
jgi:hypothetical protein